MTRQTATELGVDGQSTPSRRSDRFLAGLSEYERVIFVSHVHPDPDSLGAMVGLAHLVETCLGLPVALTRDGKICRAENRALVDLLGIDLMPVDLIDWRRPRQAVVMVDSQPRTGRHSFPANTPLYAVIDHHQTPGDLDNIPFLDICRGLGA